MIFNIKTNKKIKLVIFSDIHYAPIAVQKHFEGTRMKLTEYAPTLANALIKTVNKLKPDAVISLGDLIQNAPTYEEDVNNLKHIWSVFKNFKVPFYSVAGNHDLLKISRKELSDIMGYNNHNFSKNINEYHLVFLGLDIDKTKTDKWAGIIKTKKLSNSTIKWLKEDLKNNNLPTLIFTHFGVAEDSMKDNVYFSKNNEAALVENRKELKQILDCDKNVLGVFSGHQHWTKQINENNINYFVLGSLIENIRNKSIPDGVYFEVSLKNNKLKVKEHHLKV